MGAFWSEPGSQAVSQLRTNIAHGLTWEEARRRLRRYGYNEVHDDRRANPWKILLRQFRSPFVIILIFAALISLYQQHIGEFWVIIAVVLANALIGWVEEFRAEKTMAKLHSIIAPQARVIRESIEQKIPSRLLVPGDVVVVEAGDRVSADGRIIEARNARLNQATLTGEAIPVGKRDTILTENTALIDRDNMVFLSTLMVAGRATFVVTATGKETEVGQIARTVKAVKAPQTHLEKKLQGFNRILLTGAVLLSAAAFSIGLFYQNDPLSMLTTTLALLVSIVPEGLPIALTVVLSVGLLRMYRRHTIIRNLPATETLGSLTTLVLDKTGTLTEGELVVEKLAVGGIEYRVSGRGYSLTGSFFEGEEKIDPHRRPELDLMLELTSLATMSTVTPDDLKRDTAKQLTDPTETALAVVAAKGGYYAFRHEKEYPELLEIPFDEELRYSTSVHRYGKFARAIVKGSPERILELSNTYLQKKPLHLSHQTKEKLQSQVAEFGTQGYRVIALGYVDQPSTAKVKAEHIKNLTFVGFALMTDPIRPQAHAALQQARAAGVRTLMLTGDHLLTAQSIATKIGLMEQGIAVDADEVVHRDLGSVSVIARATPKEKLLIVEHLQRRGEIVAMTGDGVNDAPALKKADIGIAMGRGGSDIAIETSDMVLLNNNVSSIVEAISQGRLIWENIRKVVFYLTSTSLGEVVLIVTALALRVPLPLVAVQILWLNLVTDGITSMALTVEKAEGDLMKRPPRSPSEALVHGSMIRRMLLMSAVMAAGALFVFLVFLERDLAYARTAALTTLVFFQLFNLHNSRSSLRSIFTLGLFSNKLLSGLALVATALQLLAIYHPILQKALGTVALDYTTLGFCALIALSIVLADELRKLARRLVLGWAQVQQAFS